MRWFFGAALILFVGGSQAFDWPQWGRCPHLNVEQNFGIDDYMGKWFQQSGFHTYSDESNGRCVSAVYEYTGEVIKVHNQEITSSNKTQSINGTAVPDDPSKNEGKLTVTFYVPFLPFWKIKISGPYDVLGTDYNNYSVVYSCTDFLFFFRFESVWLLSRVQDLEAKGQLPKYKKQVTKVLKSNNLDYSKFTKIDQQHCDS